MGAKLTNFEEDLWFAKYKVARDNIMTQNKKILLNEGCRKTVTPTLPAPNPLHIKVCPERGDEDEEGWEETVGSPGKIVLEN